MAVSDRKHTVPGPTDTPSRAGFLAAFASVNDIVPVANVTDRDDVATAVAPSATRPLFVYRFDASAGQEIEVTEDGTNWRHVPSLATSPVMAYGFITANSATDGTVTEQRLLGGLNQSVTLAAGRAYRVKARGLLNTDTAGSNGVLNVRGAAGSAVIVADTNTCVASDRVSFSAAGSPGRHSTRLEGLFTVGISGPYVLSPFLQTSAGILTLVPDSRGRSDLWVEDAGTAPANLVSL